MYVSHGLGSPVSPESGANLGDLFVAFAFASAFWGDSEACSAGPLGISPRAFICLILRHTGLSNARFITACSDDAKACTDARASGNARHKPN